MRYNDTEYREQQDVPPDPHIISRKSLNDTLEALLVSAPPKFSVQVRERQREGMMRLPKLVLFVNCYSEAEAYYVFGKVEMFVNKLSFLRNLKNNVGYFEHLLYEEMKK